jgi:hypothetical protein
MHDTIEVFWEHLGELHAIVTGEIYPKRRGRRRTELMGAADELFGKVDDTIREAVIMATGRKLSPEAMMETSRAGLKEVFGTE